MFKRRRSRAEDAEALNAGYRYALSLSAHKQDAEDLVHDAWIRYQQRYAGEHKRSLFFTIIRNLYIDQYRRQRLYSWVEYEDDRSPVSGSGIEAGVQAATDLDSLLAGLRGVEREALFLFTVEGYTAEEIASLTSSTRGTVLSLLHRSKAKLRAMVDQQTGQSVADVIDIDRQRASRGPTDNG